MSESNEQLHELYLQASIRLFDKFEPDAEKRAEMLAQAGNKVAHALAGLPKFVAYLSLRISADTLLGDAEKLVRAGGNGESLIKGGLA